jgi:hypothetical protein
MTDVVYTYSCWVVETILYRPLIRYIHLSAPTASSASISAPQIPTTITTNKTCAVRKDADLRRRAA